MTQHGESKENMQGTSVQNWRAKNYSSHTVGIMRSNLQNLGQRIRIHGHDRMFVDVPVTL